MLQQQRGRMLAEHDALRRMLQERHVAAKKATEKADMVPQLEADVTRLWEQLQSREFVVTSHAQSSGRLEYRI